MVKYFLTFFLIFLSYEILLSKEYNREEILLRQANHYTIQKQYQKANDIYQKILDLNPKNKNALKRYVNNLIFLRKINEAKTLLKRYKNKIDLNTYEKLNITLLLYEGDFNSAEKKALKLLKKNPKQNSYKAIADLFKNYKQYEIAKNLFLKGRKELKNPNLFSYELAYIYEQLGKYKKAMQENIKLISYNKSYFYVAKKNMENLLRNDKSLIDYLENSDSQQIKELYVCGLLKIGRKQKALQIAETLSPDRIYNIAQNQQAQHNYDAAVKLLFIYIKNVHNAVKIANAKIDIAKMYLKTNQIAKAKDILLQIYGDEKIQSKRYNRLTNANVLCRKLLSEITLMEKGDETIAIKYLKEARKLSFNIKEKRDIDLQLIYLSLMKSKFKQAQDALENLYSAKRETDNKKLYYDYLLNVLQLKENADSLLVDLIIKLSDTDYTNDALLLKYYLSLLDKQDKTLFVKAYQNKKLFRYEKAHEFLEKCYEKSKKEQFLLLSMKWYIDENNFEGLKRLADKKYKNKFISNFAEYVKLSAIDEDFKQKAVEFLTKNPDFIFSPQIRRILDVFE